MNDEVCCFNCKNMAFWGGDWCCLHDLNIITFGMEDGSAIDPAKIVGTRQCDGFERRERNFPGWTEELWKMIIGSKD